MSNKKLKKLEVPCHLCGVVVERAYWRDNAVCFDCKTKRVVSNSRKYREQRTEREK